MGDLTSLAANRNCMAHTRRHERLRERVRAHMATVTWYTVSTSSSEDRNWSLVTPPPGGEGRIFSRNTRDPEMMMG